MNPQIIYAEYSLFTISKQDGNVILNYSNELSTILDKTKKWFSVSKGNALSIDEIFKKHEQASYVIIFTRNEFLKPYAFSAYGKCFIRYVAFDENLQYLEN